MAGGFMQACHGKAAPLCRGHFEIPPDDLRRIAAAMGVPLGAALGAALEPAL